MDEVFRKADAEKAAQQQAYERLHSQDSPEKIAQYTVASAHEEKFDASVNGHKVEVEWEKNKKDNADKTHKHKKPGLGIVRGTVSGLVGFGLSAGTSILGNEALNQTGIPKAMENAISLVGITARLCIPGLRRIKSRVISEYFFPAYNIRTYSIYAQESER